jgi:hypothetical protein
MKVSKESSTIYNNVLLFYIYLAFSSSAYCQQNYHPARVIPPSPTAASLGIYGNYTMGNYTGKPDISIPLYTIKTSKYAVPIQLRYDASGVKTSSQASWVGLNWSLSAGGVITRTIRGMDDLSNVGYRNMGSLPLEVNSLSQPYFYAVIDGNNDIEPDIFSYNFVGQAGKFVIEKNANGGGFLMTARNNLKIEYLTGNKWQITDDKGFQFFFGTQEVVSDCYTYFHDQVELPDDAPIAHYVYQPAKPSVTSSWYLDSIMSPDNEMIRFKYDIKSTSLSSVSKSEKMYNLLNINGGCNGGTNGSPGIYGTYKYYNSSRQLITDVYLTEISFCTGSVKFNTSDREDIESVPDINPNKPDKLSEIVITNLNGEVARRFVLKHGYFSDGSPNGRLRLDKIYEYDFQGNDKPPYVFSYFSNDIPPPSTKSIDHWGYFNSRSNPSLIPSATILSSLTEPLYFEGAVRVSDTLDVTLKKGALSSITYPTGGSTEFDFELNEYRNPQGDDAFALKPRLLSVSASPQNESGNATEPFTITEPTNVNLYFSYQEAVANPYSINIETVYAYILKDNRVIATFSNWNCLGGQTPQECIKTSGESKILLLPGNYSISVRYLQGYTTFMSASYDVREPVATRKGGGLRIKSITNFENSRKLSEKKYIYTDNGRVDGITTGQLISQPVYSYQFDLESLDPNCSWRASCLGRESATVLPLGFVSDGTIVGYDKVTEIIGENGEGGRIEYFYHSYIDVPSDFPYIPSASNPLNGKLKNSVFYDKGGLPVKELKYQYETKESFSLPGAKLFRNEMVSPYSFRVKYYETKSFWIVNWLETETLFTNNDILTTTEIKYSFGNSDHKQLTQKEFISSENKKIINRFKYPGDYSMVANSFVKELKARNIIATVIEEQSLIQEGSALPKLVSGTFNEFALYDGSYKPSVIYRLEVSVPDDNIAQSEINSTGQVIKHLKYKPFVYFDKYSPNGNIAMYHTSNLQVQSYLWGYGYTYPIAQITNASLQDVAFTSFESDGDVFEYDGTIIKAQPWIMIPTGRHFYSLRASQPLSTKETMTIGKVYIISYWSKNNAYTVSGGTEQHAVKIGKTSNGWTYHEHLVMCTQSKLRIEGNGPIDEVRVYPLGSQVTTYTYEPLAGMTSLADQSGSITYYEYDGYQRLKNVKDYSGNVLMKYDYHFATPAQN